MLIEDFDPVVTPSDEEALRRGYVFDREKADRPVKFIERLIKQSVGLSAGQPLLLLPWQKAAIWRTFGWVDPKTGWRRHRELFIEVPKKQGKGELASALALYMLVGDGEACPKIALAACDRKQALQTWKAADRMIQKSPYLAKRLETSEFYGNIKYAENDGIIETNSSDADSPDGGSLSCVIIDELHRWTGSRRKGWNVYSGSGAARAQALKIVISTAGDDRHSVMYEQHKRALRIESGEWIDIGFCGIVYGPREGEEYDVHAEETWFRFNPSLGHTMTLESFRAEYEAGKASPESFSYWKRTRLDVWGQEAARFIDRDQWVACGKLTRRTEGEILDKGDLWFCGYDLASTQDITAVVTIAGNLKDGVDVWCKCWLPEETAADRSKTAGVQYLEWADQGWIELIPGSRIDEDVILKYVVSEYERCHFINAYGDYYHAVTFGSGLEKFGIPYKIIRQGPVSLGPPTKELDRLIATGKLRHAGVDQDGKPIENPVLTWAASNAVTERDSNDNIKISRSKSHEKIDPMAALVNAIAGLIDQQVLEAKTPAPITDGRIFRVSY